MSKLIGCHVTDRWGGMESDPSEQRLSEILATLEIDDDDEHPDVSLTHESGWYLAAFPSGLIVWENVEDGPEPRHMKNVTRDKVLKMWLALARGQLETIEAGDWLSGYG